jgi:hypothetical protein
VWTSRSSRYCKMRVLLIEMVKVTLSSNEAYAGSTLDSFKATCMKAISNMQLSRLCPYKKNLFERFDDPNSHVELKNKCNTRKEYDGNFVDCVAKWVILGTLFSSFLEFPKELHFRSLKPQALLVYPTITESTKFCFHVRPNTSFQ